MTMKKNVVESVEKECGIVSDLLPLYVDNVVSEASRELVEKHIKVCEKCSKKYLEYKKPFMERTEAEPEQSYIKAFENNKRRRRKRRLIELLLEIIFTIIVVCSVLWGFRYSASKNKGDISKTKIYVNDIQISDNCTYEECLTENTLHDADKIESGINYLKKYFTKNYKGYKLIDIHYYDEDNSAIGFMRLSIEMSNKKNTQPYYFELGYDKNNGGWYIMQSGYVR